MDSQNLVFIKLEGYSGIRLKNNEPLTFRPGLNLLVGRNGSGKTNLIQLINRIAIGKGDLSEKIESSYFVKKFSPYLNDKSIDWKSIRFKEIKIIQYDFRGEKGDFRIQLKNVTQRHVLENMVNSGKSFSSNVDLIGNNVTPVRHKSISSNPNISKLETTSYLNNGNLFNTEHNNQAHAIMREPILIVTKFIRDKFNEFYTSQVFVDKIRSLENEINRIFQKFLGSTDKTVQINYSDIPRSSQISISLVDKKNVILTQDLSMGESSLLNLIFSLISAKEEQAEVITLDEPDIHMHDDMVQVLVDELLGVASALPGSIILITTHSTAFIERLAALGRDKLSVITLNEDREVCNSQKDIDLINVLQNNGVTFSPLMLSKRRTIFIENQLSGGKSHRDFFLKFFSPQELPMVIPIGSSGNVGQSENFNAVLEDIIRASKISSVGIQDGDMWFKVYLNEYLIEKLSLKELIEILQKEIGAYIQVNVKKSKFFYFNFWELENLYLHDELLECWKDKRGRILTPIKYHEFIEDHVPDLIVIYTDMFFKYLTHFKISNGSIERKKSRLIEDIEFVNKQLKESEKIALMIKSLVDALINEGMFQWMPGKEVKRLLENAGYSFADTEFIFANTRISTEIRKILEKADGKG